MTYQTRDTGEISNLYEVTFINKTFDSQTVALEALDGKFRVEVVGDQNWTLEGQAKFEGRFFVVTDAENIKINQEKITLVLTQNGEVIDKLKTSFVGPVSR
jgi:hypothetical protein